MRANESAGVEGLFTETILNRVQRTTESSSEECLQTEESELCALCCVSWRLLLRRQFVRFACCVRMKVCSF